MSLVLEVVVLEVGLKGKANVSGRVRRIQRDSEQVASVSVVKGNDDEIEVAAGA